MTDTSNFVAGAPEEGSLGDQLFCANPECGKSLPVEDREGRPRKFCDNNDKCRNRERYLTRDARKRERERLEFERMQDPEYQRERAVEDLEQSLETWEFGTSESRAQGFRPVIDDALQENIERGKRRLEWMKEAPVKFYQHAIGCDGTNQAETHCKWDSCFAKGGAAGAAAVSPLDGGYTRSEVLAAATEISSERGGVPAESWTDLSGEMKLAAVERLKGE